MLNANSCLKNLNQFAVQIRGTINFEMDDIRANPQKLGRGRTIILFPGALISGEKLIYQKICWKNIVCNTTRVEKKVSAFSPELYLSLINFWTISFLKFMDVRPKLTFNKYGQYLDPNIAVRDRSLFISEEELAKFGSGSSHF